MNSITFKSDPLLDIVLFSGVEISDNELEQTFKKQYVSINPEKDFKEYKASYSDYKRKLSFDYSQFIHLVEKNMDKLTDPRTPQQFREYVRTKIQFLDQNSSTTQKRNLKNIVNNVLLKKGEKCCKILEREGKCINIVKRIFKEKTTPNGSEYPLSTELLMRINKLDEVEFDTFLNQVFFNYNRSYEYLNSPKKLTILSHLNPERKDRVIQEILKRDDWYIQLYEAYPTPLYRQDEEEHKKLIVELPESDFIHAFSKGMEKKGMEKMIKFRNDKPNDGYEAITSYPYRETVIKMFIEKALQIYLKTGDSAQLTHLIQVLQKNNCLPEDGNKIEDNILADIFAKSTILSQQEIARLKEILPPESYNFRIVQVD